MGDIKELSEDRDATPEEIMELYESELKKLFSGKYEVMVESPDDASKLNFSQLLRSFAKTLNNVIKRVQETQKS